MQGKGQLGHLLIVFVCIVVVVVVTLPLLRDGAMAEDHGALEARQLSRSWTRGRRETESRQTASGTKSP